MRKRIALVLLVLTLIVAPCFAEGSMKASFESNILGLGGSFGYDTGLIDANVGLQVPVYSYLYWLFVRLNTDADVTFPSNLSARVNCLFRIINAGKFSFKVGAGASGAINVINPSEFGYMVGVALKGEILFQEDQGMYIEGLVPLYISRTNGNIEGYSLLSLSNCLTVGYYWKF
ncbi:MAG: hypothetical protein WCR02_08600 [Sphaerochaetaceae bacterium]